ncbi:MAG TPA: tetratricopeptide repeat protein [Steroidobacteraceae bacterium]|jgi:hypothetical protein|nr:tetratricopeptide repeat protein [Steroidobacteraceae bacterium]
MGLSSAQFARSAALEADQARLQRLASMGDAELRALLGGDLARAAAWIASAAECGVVDAQLCLGRMLLAGQGVACDAAVALRWFERAAAQGSAAAWNMIGRCQEHGWGLAADTAAAAHSYRRSAEAGHDWGQYNLGNLLFDGRGLACDQPAALRWYLQAAQQGHARAMNLVGRCLEEGWGCAARPGEAAYWYRRSAESGYFRGQFNHALALLEAGQLEPATQWLRRAALGGDAAMRRAILARIDHQRAAPLAALAAQIRAIGAL